MWNSINHLAFDLVSAKLKAWDSQDPRCVGLGRGFVPGYDTMNFAHAALCHMNAYAPPLHTPAVYQKTPEWRDTPHNETPSAGVSTFSLLSELYCSGGLRGLNSFLLAFNTLEKLVERIGEFLDALVLQLLCHLVIVDAHFFQRVQGRLSALGVFLDG